MIFVQRKCWILTLKVEYTFLQDTLYKVLSKSLKGLQDLILTTWRMEEESVQSKDRKKVYIPL